jgi:hypothetical protein
MLNGGVTSEITRKHAEELLKMYKIAKEQEIRCQEQE